MKFIKKVPIPLAGVMLGFAALGNLLQSYSEGIRSVCGIVAGVLLVLLILKLVCFPGMIREDMKNPIMASVSGTVPMTIMLLSTYVKPLIGPGAIAIWYFGIALHICLIIYFTLTFVKSFDLKKVFASWYIVYVGIVVGSITAPAFEKTGIGAGLFWFGLITLIVLLIAVTMRYSKIPVPEPARPLICIYAAPTSLCIAGYVQSVTPKNRSFLIALWVIATVLYVFALVKAIGYLKLKFYPSYASFTFPFVISAIASKQTMACCAKMEQPLPFLAPIVLIETIIATVFVVYTLIRFLMFLTASEG